jgi:hypothetical protein
VVSVIAVAALHLIVRFTSTFLSIYIHPEQWAMLSRARMDVGGRAARRPEGRPILRWTPMSLHRVFGNGIFTEVARLDLAEAPKMVEGAATRAKLAAAPGFIAFDDVVGIYDIALMEVSKRPRKRRVPAAGFQVETSDFRTALLEPPFLEPPKTRATLHRAMARSRAACYRGAETLLGVKAGTRRFRDQHMQRLLRSMPGYAQRRRSAMEGEGVRV